MSDLAETLGRILAKHGARVLPSSCDPPCGRLPWQGEAEPGKTYCDGHVHLVAEGKENTRRPAMHERCYVRVGAEIRARLEDERILLAGPLARSGGGRFDGYNGTRCKGAAEALAAMLRFSQGCPPTRGVLLSGTTGTGKTRLLLASHFALIAAGVGSRYVTAGELRDTFKRLSSFDEAAHKEAERDVAGLANTPALHLDDLADVRGTEQWHANFSAGLKGLLDKRKGAMAVALNCTAAEALQHPDIGNRVLSRLLDGAETVRIEGRDMRAASARRAT